MTSATEELRRLLDERGVEWQGARGALANSQTFFSVGRWHVTAEKLWYDKERLAIRMKDALTPEQAIAATLGSEREKRLEKLVRIYGEISNYFCERFACCDAEFANCKYCIGLPQGGQCELGWCNDVSKELGIEQPDYGGVECEPVNLQELYDRIGELENERAELGSGTCTRVKSGTKPDGSPRYRCSNCKYGIGDKRWSYCPKCGRKVAR